MNILEFFQIVRRNLFYLLFFPSLLAGGVYFFTKDKPLVYHSTTLLYTGVVSGNDINNVYGHHVDNNSVSNAFDNLTSIAKLRDVAEETSIRLLAFNLMENPEHRYFDEETHQAALKLLPSVLVKKLVDNTSLDKTVNNITFYYKNSQSNNQVTKLLASNNPFYSILAIQYNIAAYRKSSSDIIEIYYECQNRAICYQTLELLSETIIKRYKEIKTAETAHVVSYYEEKAKVAKQNLETSEQKLVDFGIKNKIINFDQQTKSIESSKESVIDNIEKEKMTLSSAEASLSSLNKKLNMRTGLLESNNTVVAKRQRLADLNYKISNAEINGQGGADLEKTKEEADNLRNELQELVGDLYQRNNTQEGLQGSLLLGQWLKNLLTIDESNARLRILNKRLKEFDATYDQYAPMGSVLASLQREVNIAEKEYLDVLNMLNQSNLKQQNISYGSNLKILEPPTYPTAPNALKNKLLVLAAFVCGFILILGFLLGKELLNDAIKTPDRAENFTGLKVAGNFCLIDQKKSSIDKDKLESNLMEQTISSLLLDLGSQESSKFNKRILISSLRNGEGKTWCAIRLANKLSNRNSVLLLTTEVNLKSGKEYFIDPSVSIVEYDPRKNLMQMSDLHRLSNSEIADLDKFQYVIIEIPALTETQLPLQLIKEADQSLLILNAERKWKYIDSSVIDLFKKASVKPALVLLNRVSTDILESILGEMPKMKKGFKEEKKAPALLNKVNQENFR